MTLRTPAPAALPLLCAALWAGLVLGCRTAPKEAKESDPSSQINTLLRHGEYEEALRVARADHEAHPGDEQAAQRYRLTSVAWLLERVRRLSFEGRREDAFVQVRSALELGPDVPQALAWEKHLRTQLARSQIDHALELLAKDDLDGAASHFELALEHTPNDATVQSALAHVLLQKGTRQGLGEQYYQTGLAALNDYFLEQARHDFSSTIKFDPSAEHAQARNEETSRLLANQRQSIAAELEAEQRWAAARNEYRLALLLHKDDAAAQAGLARMEIEDRVGELLRSAERELGKGAYDKAVGFAQAALDLTAVQKPTAESYLEQIEEARLGSIYERALTFEKAQQYPEAITEFDAILGRTPFFRDTISRKDTLQSYVSEAAQLYERALASSDPQEQLGLLRRIAVYWEAYKDVKPRTAQLERELAAVPSATGTQTVPESGGN